MMRDDEIVLDVNRQMMKRGSGNDGSEYPTESSASGESVNRF